MEDFKKQVLTFLEKQTEVTYDDILINFEIEYDVFKKTILELKDEGKVVIDFTKETLMLIPKS